MSGILNQLGTSGCEPCGQKTVQEEQLSSHCSTYSTEGCDTFTKLSCVFWDGDDYPTLGITKGMRVSHLILNLINRIITLEANLD